MDGLKSTVYAADRFKPGTADAKEKMKRVQDRNKWCREVRQELVRAVPVDDRHAVWKKLHTPKFKWPAAYCSIASELGLDRSLTAHDCQTTLDIVFHHAPDDDDGSQFHPIAPRVAAVPDTAEARHKISTKLIATQVICNSLGLCSGTAGQRT